MKRRIALISSCAPPKAGGPITGGGLRTEQLAQTLRGGGHSVRLFIQQEALSDAAPDALREHAFSSDSLARQVASFRPSVIVVEQWALVPLLADLDKPLVIDLHGSLLLENVYRRGDIDLVLDAGSKIQALARADLLLVPAQVQVHHFAAWATLAGFDPRELPIAVMPLAMATAPKRRRAKKPTLRVVYGGARWPWIDSASALRTAADVVASLTDARLDIATFEPPRHGLEFEEDLGTWPAILDELSGREDEGIVLHERQSHSDWQRLIQHDATLALDLWEPNPERMLAATTRSVEFLWAGLGIITVRGAAWSDPLIRTGAGWTLAPGDDDGLKSLLKELAADPGQLARASKAATALIEDQHQLLAAGAALLNFCAKPSQPARSAHTLTDALSAIREEQLAEDLRSLRAAHDSEHNALVAAHRGEQNEDRARHKSEIDALSQQHGEQVNSLVEKQQTDIKNDRYRHSEEIKQITTKNTKKIDSLVNNSQSEIERLEEKNKAKIVALVAQSVDQLREADKSANATAKLAAKEHRDAMATARVDQRDQLRIQEQAHRSESKELVSTWRGRLAELETRIAKQEASQQSELRALAEQHRVELRDVVTDHRGQISALTDQHGSQSQQQADEYSAALASRDERAREELAQAVGAHRGEIEALVEDNRTQIAELTAERQNEVQRIVGQSRAELEQADERHRAETRSRVDEMQQRHHELQESINVLQEQMAAERRRVKEDRTHQEVQLRAEMSARELELQQEMVRREAELGALLDLANRSLAQKLRARIGGPAGDIIGGGRLAPATRLARLWAQHAVDHVHDDREE